MAEAIMALAGIVGLVLGVAVEVVVFELVVLVLVVEFEVVVVLFVALVFVAAVFVAFVLVEVAVGAGGLANSRFLLVLIDPPPHPVNHNSAVEMNITNGNTLLDVRGRLPNSKVLLNFISIVAPGNVKTSAQRTRPIYPGQIEWIVKL